MSDSEEPEVWLSLSPQVIAPGGSSVLTASWRDNAVVQSVTVRLDGALVTLSGTGTATLSPSTPGVHVVEAVVVDASGNTATAVVHLGVHDASDTTAPVVSLTTPLADEIVLMTGTVTESNLVEWRLRLESVDGEEERLLARGAGEVSGALGVVDGTLLENGWYSLVLEAVDVNGVETSTSVAIEIQGGAKIGIMRLSFVDLQIALSGIPITITRTYDSRVKARRDFGVGWDLEVTTGRFQHNRTPGLGWSIHENFPGPSFPCTVADETQTHLTTVRLSDREWYRFRPRMVNLASSFGSCYADVAYEYVDGYASGASLDILSNTAIVHLSGTDEIVDDVSGLPWEPDELLLTTYDGRQITLDRGIGITRLEDRNGNALTISSDGIEHSNGRSISLDRDGSGRITTITDALGFERLYGYDARGDLVSYIDPEENETRFTYDRNHNIVDIIDPLGFRGLRNEYDDSGRLIATVDALGRRAEVAHDLVGRRETLTDRLGYTRYIDYDEAGNTVREVFPGSPSAEIARTFDAGGNVLSETNEMGETKRQTYDARNLPLTITNALGETSTITYSSSGRALTFEDARGGLITLTYDSSGNLETTTDASGFTSTQVVDAHGNVERDCDARGFCRSVSLDSFGNMTREVDRRGSPVDFTYDEMGQLLTLTTTRSVGGSIEEVVASYVFDRAGHQLEAHYPDGSVRRTEYNAEGLVSARIDGLGQRVEYQYDAVGQLIATIFPDGTAETTTYDFEGRAISQTDRLGRSTAMAYDDRGRMIERTIAGETSFLEYDLAGRLTSITDPRGETTEYAYDAVGRLVQTTDPLGGISHRTYDAAGNMASVTDAIDQTTVYTRDARSLVTRTDYADGTFELFTYDEAGNQTTITDRAGLTTSVEYDGEGKVVGALEPAGGTWSFEYDERGRIVAQIDPNGHALTFTRDPLGRETSRRMDLGPAQMRTYDLGGRVVALQNYSGTTTEYRWDVNGRIGTRIEPEQIVMFSNSPTGRRLSAWDASGTTVYTYDSQDRLESVARPDGRVVSYTRDANGNVLSMVASDGSTAWTNSYTYDEMNRISSVSADGEDFTLTYDSGGRASTVTYPNGLTTSYTYDASDLIETIVVRNEANAVVLSQSYTRGPSGNVVTEQSGNGVIREYEYDLSYRLVLETVRTATAVVRLEGFAYDDAGNRTVRHFTPPGGGIEIIMSTYDGQDQLVAAGGTSFSWDDDGRLLSRSGADGFDAVWDSQDRLRRLEHASGAAEDFDYDVDRMLSGTTVTPTAGPARESLLIVDSSGSFSHVVGESDPSTSSLRARYVRAGDRLLAAVRPGSTRYFHQDQLGSVRALSDGSGAVTDTYSYRPFGELASHSGTDAAPYLFAGERFDSRQRLSFNRARWMDPAAGRFLSIDPLHGMPGYSPYTYAENSPASFADPSGLAICISSPPEGLAYHTLLYADYLLRGPLPPSYVHPLSGSIVPARVANRSYSTILFLRGLSRLWGDLAQRPDLAHRALKEFHEIKVDNQAGVALGDLEIEEYQVNFQLFDPFEPWRPGTSYVPPPLIGSGFAGIFAACVFRAKLITDSGAS